jgi:hypothetical protein
MCHDCPFFTSSTQKDSEYVKKFIQNPFNGELWFSYFKDLHDEQIPPPSDDDFSPETTEQERQNIFRAKNRQRNKKVMSMVRALVVLFNVIKIEELLAAIPHDNVTRPFSWLNLLLWMKDDYIKNQQKPCPMLAAIVWSVYSIATPYYGHGSPYHKEIQKSTTMMNCEKIAPLILNPELNLYDDVVAKIWLLSKEKKQRKKKGGRKKSTALEATTPSATFNTAKSSYKATPSANSSKATPSDSSSNNAVSSSSSTKRNLGITDLAADDPDDTTISKKARNSVSESLKNADEDGTSVGQKIFNILFLRQSEHKRNEILSYQTDKTKTAVARIEAVQRDQNVYLMSEFIEISEILLYVLGNVPAIQINYILFDGDYYQDDNQRHNLIKSFGEKYTDINQMSIVDATDFKDIPSWTDIPEAIFTNEKCLNFLRVSDLLKLKINVLPEKYLNIFIYLHQLDKILITPTIAEAEMLWKYNPNQYRVITFDGFKKSVNGIMTIRKAISWGASKPSLII